MSRTFSGTMSAMVRIGLPSLCLQITVGLSRRFPKMKIQIASARVVTDVSIKTGRIIGPSARNNTMWFC